MSCYIGRAYWSRDLAGTVPRQALRRKEEVPIGNTRVGMWHAGAPNNYPPAPGGDRSPDEAARPQGREQGGST